MERYTCGLSDEGWTDKGSQEAVLTPHISLHHGCWRDRLRPLPNIQRWVEISTEEQHEQDLQGEECNCMLVGGVGEQK